VPHNCPVFVGSNIKLLKKLLQIEVIYSKVCGYSLPEYLFVFVPQHKNVLSLAGVDYVHVDKRHFLTTFQEIVERGSLKHQIHGVK